MGEQTLSADTVIAQSFLMKDGTGRLRAVLGTTDTGGASLTLLDGEGHERLRLLVPEAGEGEAIISLLGGAVSLQVERASSRVEAPERPAVGF